MIVFFLIAVCAMMIFFYYMLKTAGKTCADCRNLKNCWKKIDEYTYDNPACSYFQERKDIKK